MTAGDPDPRGAAAFWDARYAADAESYGAEPSAFLAACAGMLPTSGRALLPGDGQGRNGAWLAARGLDVLSADLSETGLAQARARAEALGTRIETAAGDFLDLELEAGAFALVAAIYFHVPAPARPRAYAKMAEALAPGGLLLVEAFAPGQEILKAKYDSGGPPDPALYVSEATLRADLPGLRALYVEELETRMSHGRLHSGPARVTRALLRKPG